MVNIYLESKNMYKCKNCGNNEKFYGIAHEKGNVLIYLISDSFPEYSWSYKLSDNSWQSSFEPQECYFCGCREIKLI
jgi:hypothetical protein